MPGKTGKEEKIAVKRFFPFLAAFSVFLIDRISKTAVMARYPEGGGFDAWPGMLHLTRVSNTGAAFGILKESGFLLPLISAVSIVFFVFYLVRKIFIERVPVTLSHWAWALVAAGASGNLYDRLRFGYVVDFIDLRVWPVFNIADVSICVGVFFVGLRILSRPKG